ncbi:MAG: PepSY domain-containing protein [Hyphomicrobiales bacterium]|nr:PepSY domain-containing protein [Hyphomicrobiales bacterium]MCP5371848.1 PepSY domain-containing protein [Hyphomicrobiales bacterium]
MRRLRAAIPALAAALLAALPAAAPRADDDHDHDRARVALREGKIQPLARVLDRIAADYPGDVLEVELEVEDAGERHPYVYEIRLLTRDGRVLKLELDAATLEVLEVRGRKDDDD